MARSLEQKHKAQHSTSRYLILREALEIKETSADDLEKIFENKATKIIHEEKQLHFDDFVKKNPWGIFDIFNLEIQDNDRNKIKERLKKKKAELDILSPEEREYLKKLFLDNELKNRLIKENNNQDEQAKTPVADTVDQIYKSIKTTSKTISSFKQNVDEIADNIFKTQTTLVPYKSSEVKDRINKVIDARKLSKNIFKNSIDKAFQITTSGIIGSTSSDNFIDFVNERTNAIIQESGNDDLIQLNKKRLKYDNAGADEAPKIREEFNKDLQSFYDKTTDPDSIDKAHLIFVAISYSIKKKKILTDENIKKDETLLNKASYLITSVANITLNNQKIPASDIKKYSCQLSPSLISTLKEKTILKEENIKLKELINTENELLSPLLDAFKSFAKTTSSLTSGLVESVVKIGQNQQIGEDKLPSAIDDIFGSLVKKTTSFTSELMESVATIGQENQMKIPSDEILLQSVKRIKGKVLRGEKDL